jgi:ubiquinone biosynthesis protein
MASASVAQVHCATLHSGEQVVVKVVRPDIEPVIRQDLALMFTLARLVAKYVPEGKRLRPVEVVADYKLVILDELDLGREAANASQLRRNFDNSKLLYIPRVYWDYTCRNVFTMERISGIPVTDMDALRAKGTDLKVLGEMGVEIFFTQVFRDSFFHADMHPGNIFVITTDPDRPKYAAVDFGIVGTLSPDDQRYLAENFLAFFDRNYHRIAKLHLDSGWVPAGTRVDQLESAVRTVCEPIFNKPLSEISFAQVLMRLFRVAQRFDVEIQPQMILLHKTLFNIEGLGRELYPELDLWKTAHPVLKRWMDEQVGGRALLKDVRDNLPQLRDALRELPAAIQTLSEQAANGKIRLNLKSPELEHIQSQLAEQRRQRYWLTVAGVGIIAATLVLTLGNLPWLGWPLLGAGVAAGITAK